MREATEAAMAPLRDRLGELAAEVMELAGNLDPELPVRPEPEEPDVDTSQPAASQMWPVVGKAIAKWGTTLRLALLLVIIQTPVDGILSWLIARH